MRSPVKSTSDNIMISYMNSLTYSTIVIMIICMIVPFGVFLLPGELTAQYPILNLQAKEFDQQIIHNSKFLDDYEAVQISGVAKGGHGRHRAPAQITVIEQSK